MAIDKPSLENFLPNGFETQNKDGWKANFDSDKITTGFDKDTLEVLSGPNLNNLLDKTGKNFNTLQQFLDFFKNMPIGSFPIVNTSNQLDYKSVNSFFRNVGELVFSAIPLEDGNLRLLDGSLLEYTMTYSRFITYIAGLRSSLPNLFCTEQEFNQSVATYGVCGKFVYDTVTKSLRLPKISGFIQGTLDSGSLAEIVEAGLPNITASMYDYYNDIAPWVGGSFYRGGNTNRGGRGDMYFGSSVLHFDASRSSSIYGNSTTVQPQAIKEFIYIVVSIDEAEKQVLSAVYNYKGSVATYAELPTDAAIGEVYNVIGEDPEGYSGANFAWTGEEWDRLGGTVNLSGYLTKVEGANTYATKASLESNVDYLQGQININASNIANIASEEVIQEGIKKIEMLKFASTLGIGKVTDTDLFAVINKYKRSSFDLSKFTVVGSPTITSDGIASGFSTSNYLTKSFSTPIDLRTQYLEIKQDVIYNGNAKTLYTNSDYWRIRWEIETTGVAIRYSDYTVVNADYSRSISDGEELTIIATLHSGDNTLEVYDSNGNKVAEASSTYSADSSEFYSVSSLAIGSCFNGGAYENVILDLKQFSITVDGVEVFSGNKTGIDTIKPDDYTVVGTPTISADGVASGFSTSNYLYKTGAVTINSDGIFEINFTDIKTTGTSANQTLIVLYQSSSDFITFYRNGPYANYDMTVYSNGTRVVHEDYLNTSINSITGKIGYDGTQYYSQINRTSGYNFTPVVANKVTSGVYDVYIGINYGISTPATSAVIDLNRIKITNSNGLVYQPCLKIPYTESKTGLKITDKLDRAIDLSEQCGFSQYFGLDEQNGLCLVPQGDNITGRRDLISRVEDSTTHYVTEIYSDLYCKQMGSGTASTAVTLNIPYKDANYKLSVPQSAKSKTGFTPTASSDWTAEGYIYLDEVI